MIEKCGHSKRMQIMRKEWINEGKLKETIEDISTSTIKISKETSATPKADELSTSKDLATRPRTPTAHDTNDDDLYLATPKRPSNTSRQPSAPGDSLFISDDESGDHPPDDDLDLLLAEDGMKDANMKPAADDDFNDEYKSVVREDTFDDEMEAMAGTDDIW